MTPEQHVYRLVYFVAVGFLFLAFVVKAFPNPTSTGMSILGTSVTIVSWGISRKLAETQWQK